MLEENKSPLPPSRSRERIYNIFVDVRRDHVRGVKAEHLPQQAPVRNETLISFRLQPDPIGATFLDDERRVNITARSAEILEKMLCIIVGIMASIHQHPGILKDTPEDRV